MKQILTATALAVAFAAPLAAQTFPAQHWATTNGIVDVQPNGLNDWTPEQVAEIRQIEETFYRWAIFYDEGRSDLLPSLLTEDVVVTVLLGSPEPIGVFEGIEAVAGYNDGSLAQQMDQRRHVMSNVLVDRLDENSASATAFGLVIQAADGLALGALVLYTAELEKGEDGVWRYAEFTIAIDDYAGNLAEPE